MELNFNYEINKKSDKVHITYETFDFYSNNPEPFSNLLSIDKDIFSDMLNFDGYKLYALMQISYINKHENNLGVFKYWAIDMHSDEFKFVVKFDKPICEFEKYTSEYKYSIGLAEISLDFYLQNYSFFNHEGDDIGLIIIEETKLVTLVELIKKYNGRLDFNNLLETLMLEGGCTTICTKDTHEFKDININISIHSNELFTNLKKIKLKYMIDVHGHNLIEERLLQIRHCPGMFIGAKKFTNLYYYMLGYKARLMEENEFTNNGLMFMDHLNNFIRFKYSAPLAIDWKIILYRVKDEEKAFDKFYELFDEFCKLHSNNLDHKNPS